MWTATEQREPVRIVETETEDDEARYVFDTIAHLAHTRQFTHWSDVAILYRTNSQSRALEEAALQASIPYQVVGSTMFYQRKEVKDFLAYLHVLINERDDGSLERIINTPTRGIGRTTVDALKEWSESRSFTLVKALEHIHEWTSVSRTQKQALSRFSHMISALRRAVDDLPFTELLDLVASTTGLERALREGTEEQQDRWENILELKRVASKFSGVETAQALLLFLEHVALMSGADRVEASEKDEGSISPEKRDAVTFTTLHAAKGLEFLIVFIAGVEEGLIPHSRTFLDSTNDSLEEEARLLYVGFTRAKHSLYCVHAARRYAFGRTIRTTPSRFLEVIPPHLTQKLE